MPRIKTQLRSSLYPFSSVDRMEYCFFKLQELEIREEKLRKNGKYVTINCDHKGIKDHSRCPYCKGGGKILLFSREFLHPKDYDKMLDLRRLFEIARLDEERKGIRHAQVRDRKGYRAD
ncbi:MAG: hypothetical protein QW561_02515 [Candidatus Aenigmatarchaeota archaeon]